MNERVSDNVLEDRKLMVVRLNRLGTITYVNSCFLNLTGYAEDEILKKNWFQDFLPPDVGARLNEVFRKAMKDGVGFPDYENVTVSGSNERLVIHWSNVIEREGSGRPVGILSVGEDITEFQRAMKALRDERSQMNVVISSLNTGLALINNSMTFEWTNELMKRFFPRGDPVGKKCYDFTQQRSEPCEDCQALLTFEDGRIHERDLFNPVMGIWFHVVVQPVMDMTGRVLKVLISSTDVTEQKQAGESLRKSEEKFRGFFSRTPGYSYIISSAGTILDVNGAALDVMGLRKEELVGKPFTSIYAPESLPRVRDLFSSEVWRRKGELRGEELVIVDAAGQNRTVLLSAGEVRDQEGRIIHSTSILTDITELKRAQEARDTLMTELKDIKNRLEEENVYLREKISDKGDFSDIIGKSNSLLYVLMKVKEVAATDSTVLIEGETGVGKERVARAIHGLSARANKPFITVNCAALPQALAESELFGHEPGAFTGAQRLRKGRFELADGGTIFLDEIGEMPPDIQVKLLRVLQNQEFERVGGTQTLRVNVRVIAATNHVLFDEVTKGRFRPDLFYRLNVYPITVPPLRRRREDIALLVEYFVRQISERMGKDIDQIPPGVLEQFRSYNWPGNVRELMNVVERAVIITQGRVLRLPQGALGEGGAPPPNPGHSGPEDFVSLEDHERQYILKVLAATGWRVSGPKGAARILRMNPSTLESRIKKLRIARDASKSGIRLK